MSGARQWWKRLQFGLPTVLGLAPKGFFIPYRHARSVTDPIPLYALIEALFVCRTDGFAAWLAYLEQFWLKLSAFDTTLPPAPPLAPR